jgi:predicted nucleic acid-binding protein
MPYLIDSDVLINHRDEDPGALTLLERLAPEGIAISVVTYMEVYQGILRSPDADRAQSNFAAFLAGVPVVPFSVVSARRCAVLREGLSRRGKRVRSRALDLITAAIALEHGYTLVTRNRNDYEDIPGLSLHEPT